MELQSLNLCATARGSIAWVPNEQDKLTTSSPRASPDGWGRGTQGDRNCQLECTALSTLAQWATPHVPMLAPLQLFYLCCDSWVLMLRLHLVLWPYGPHIHSHRIPSDRRQHGPSHETNVIRLNCTALGRLTLPHTSQLRVALTRFQPAETIAWGSLPLTLWVSASSSSLLYSNPVVPIRTQGDPVLSARLQSSQNLN